jgi:hypothetical protein
MKVWKVALFDRNEAHAIQTAQRSIDIVFPVEGPDAYPVDHPGRTVLRGLGSRNDPLTEARLRNGQDVLEQLITATNTQASRDYWLAQLDFSDTGYAYLGERERTMIDTLVDARTIQCREATIALHIVERALALVGGHEEEVGGVWETAVEDAEQATASAFGGHRV